MNEPTIQTQERTESRRFVVLDAVAQCKRCDEVFKTEGRSEWVEHRLVLSCPGCGLQGS